MRISYNWLSSYFAEKLPSPEELAEILTMHTCEVEGIEKVEDDYVFDLAVLPNRAHDLLSHVGMAKEVSAITGKKIKQLLHPQELPITDRLEVTIENFADTPRLTALLIENIEIKESPEWMKKFLVSIGLRPINNIVDATNLTMFHVGQPLHAYDREKLTSKDGKWHLKSVNEDGTLYIKDGNSDITLGVAGIKGGKESLITNETKNIIVEAANFNSTLIRKASKKLKLRTDASERFEKEITPELTSIALEEFIALLPDLSPNAKVIGIVDNYPKKRNPYLIGVSLEEINKKLGINLSEEDVEETFNKLGFTFVKVKPIDHLTELSRTVVGVPYKYGTSLSYDTPKTFDCSALVNYLYTHAGIAIPRISSDQVAFGDEVEKKDIKAGDVIFANRSNEEEVHHFVKIDEGKEITQHVQNTETREFKSGTNDPKNLLHNGVYLGDGKIIHASGLTHKGQVVIEDISESSLFKNIQAIRRYTNNEERYVVTIPAERLDLMAKRAFLVSGTKEDLIEEIGRIYGYEKITTQALPETSFRPQVLKEAYVISNIRQELIKEGYSEVMTYAFVNKGEVELQNPIASDKKFLRPSLLPAIEKAYKENLLNKDLLELDKVKIFEIGKIFKDGKEILVLAKMPDKTEENLEERINKTSIPDRFEFNLNSKEKIFSPVSPYPFITRDIAVFVPEGTSPEEVEKKFENKLTDLCIRKRLFDSFLKTFEDGTKKQSFAWRFVFQSMDRTLTDEEINAIMKEVEGTLKDQGYEIR